MAGRVVANVTATMPPREVLHKTRPASLRRRRDQQERKQAQSSRSGGRRTMRLGPNGPEEVELGVSGGLGGGPPGVALRTSELSRALGDRDDIVRKIEAQLRDEDSDGASSRDSDMEHMDEMVPTKDTRVLRREKKGRTNLKKKYGLTFLDGRRDKVLFREAKRRAEGGKPAAVLYARPDPLGIELRNSVKDERKTASMITGGVARGKTSAAAAAARKQRMLRLDERRRQKAAARTAKADQSLFKEEEARMAAEEAANPSLRRARELAIEDDDEIKAYNVRLGLARAVKEQEMQKVAAARRKEAEQLQERAHHALMEQRRLDEIKHAREQMEAKQAARRKAAAELRAQLKEREKARELEREAKELEGRAILAGIKQQEAADRAAARQREVEAKKRRDELAAANRQFARRKRLVEEEEKRRDLEAMRWQMQQAKREQEAADEAARKKKERDLAFGVLQAQQQRAIDRRGEEDEKRAKAYQEQKERQDRERIRKQKEQKEQLMQQVMRERRMQLELKRRAKQAEAEADRRQAEADRRSLEVSVRREREERRQHKMAQLLNGSEVVKQLEEREAARRAEHIHKYKEREQIVLAEARRKRRVAQMRAKKRQQLEREGVSGVVAAKTRL